MRRGNVSLGNAASFFSIKTQFENVGDALINRELIKLAASQSDVVVDVSRCDKNFADDVLHSLQDRVKVVGGGFFGLLLSMLVSRLAGKKCYYYLSPGGYFGDVRGAYFAGKILNTLVLATLSILGIRICHAGVSYERMGGGFSRIIRLRSRILFRHFVRDQLSLQIGSALGFRIDGVLPDLAFNIFDETQEDRHVRDGIVFSFRVDQDSGQRASVEAFIKICDQFYPTEVPFIFYAQVGRDVDPMRALADDLRGRTNRSVEFHSVLGSIEASLNFLSMYEFVATNRLHVMLMAASGGTKVLATSYKNFNEKLVGITSDLRMQSSCIDLQKIESLNIGELKFVDISIKGRELGDQLRNGFHEVYIQK